MNAPLSGDPTVQRAKLTARDYWLLADAGAFSNYAKTELIEGEIWVVNSVCVWHARTMAHFVLELGMALRDTRPDLLVHGSGSVDLAEDSVPEPDISVGLDHDGKGLPAGKLALAVEVSDTTLLQDLSLRLGYMALPGFPNIG